jgi:hypothetical protein
LLSDLTWSKMIILSGMAPTIIPSQWSERNLETKTKIQVSTRLLLEFHEESFPYNNYLCPTWS